LKQFAVGAKVKLTFRAKVSLPIISVVIVSFLIVGVILYFIFHKEIEHLAIESAWHQSYRYGNLIKSKFDVAVNVALAVSDTAVNFPDEEGDRASFAFDYITKVLASNSGIYSVWIAYEPNIGFDGQFAPSVFTDGEEIKRSYTFDYSEDRYQSPAKSGKAFISIPKLRIFEGKEVKTISIGIPFQNRYGELLGVAGVDLTLDYLSEIISQIKPYGTGYAFLLSQDLIMLAHPTPSTLGKPSAVADELRPFAEKRQEHMLERFATATGIFSYTFYSPIFLDKTDYIYYMCTSVPKDDVLAALKGINWIVISIAAVATAFVSLIITVTLGRLVKTLGVEPAVLVEKVNEIAKGDFTVRLDLAKGDTKSVAYHFNLMADDLNTLFCHTSKLLATLKAATLELSSSVGILSQGMEEQMNRSAQISAASEQTSASTAEIAGHISEIAAFSSQTADTVLKGKDTVSNSVEKISVIKSTVDDASTLVNQLEAKSTEIKNIVAVITNIADQTNLLALNAAIEAARAGESGRGFAVVADEVRKLAENTQKSTSEIAHLITANQKEIENVIRSMVGVNNQVNDGVESSKKTTFMLEEIEQGVTQLHNMVFSISAVTQQVSESSNLILNDISSVVAVSSEVKTTADILGKSVLHLEEVYSELEKRMNQFKVNNLAEAS
jgi:methyl-accepting chemotaxis protein